MIINQHRKFTPINILWVSVISLFLCIGIFINLPEDITPILFEPAIHNLIGFEIGARLSPVSNVTLTLILTLLQAFFLNRIISQFIFLGKPNFMGALMFITLVSLFPSFLVLSPPLICSFIAIWMLEKLFSIYKQTDIKALMFDLGMIVALGSLVYFPFMSMILLLWFGLIIYRPFNWREWASTILGFATIYFLLGVVYFWLDRTPKFIKIFEPLSYAFPTELSLNTYDYIVIIPILITLLFFLFVLKDHFYKSIVHLRKSIQLLFFMILLTFGSFYLNDHITINHFLMCIPAVSIYMAFYYTNSKSKWVYESLYLITLITIVYFQLV